MPKKNSFKLKILTPDEKLFEGEVTQVVLPTKAGEITVLANHVPLISLLGIGEIKVSPATPSLAGASATPSKEGESQAKVFLVQGGVIDVKQSSEVIILADEKIDAEKVDKENSKTFQESLDRAKKANKENNSAFNLETFESQIERSSYFKRLKS